MTHPVLVTHSGKFHCDEVFAYAVLRLALDLKEPGVDHTLLRTRAAKRIEDGTYVWDVGSVFNPAAGRFDHHQRGAPSRPDGTPFSSAGLVWQVFGERAVSALLAPGAQSYAPAIAAEIDQDVVHRIDQLDNGVGPDECDTLGLSSLVQDRNPSWDDPAADGPQAGDAAFLATTELVLSVLSGRVETLRARIAAEARVLAAYQAGDDPRLLVLECGMPWKNAVFTHDLPVLFTISPASNGNWMLDTMPPEPGSFGQRLALPEAWAGLQGPDLVAETGVPGAVFCHLRRFVAAAETQEAAIGLARIALLQAADAGFGTG